MRDLLGAALKDNPHLLKAVLTGILRVAKENLFSGLNNLKVLTVLDNAYAQYFGFTEAEVAALAQTTGLAAKHPALEANIKDWYNGYRFGGEVIYNPWSIVSCLDEKGVLKPYWLNTSGADLLKRSMERAETDFKEGLESVIRGTPVEQLVDPNLVFADLDKSSTALWSLLLFSGYLTADNVSYQEADGRARCRLRIPNREIGGLYRRHIEEWFSDTMGLTGYRAFLASLTEGRVEEFETRLREYLLDSMSHFDAQGRHPEKFYHGLVLGMIVGLSDTHTILSNRESGLGRYDVALFPRSPAAGKPALGVLVEFKQTSDPSQLQAAAASALSQIDTRHYETELKQHPITGILKLGMAFAGKEVAIAHQRTAY
jgi:hypothetical protein